MKKRVFCFLLSIALLCAVLPASPVRAEAVRSVALSPSEITIEVGATAELRAIVDPDGAIPGSVNWMSGNSAIAEVNPGPSDSTRCIVTGVYPGVAQIACDMDAVRSTTTIVNVSGVVLSEHEMYLDVGSSRTLNRTAYGDAAAVLTSNWQWSSSDTSVARVAPSAAWSPP